MNANGSNVTQVSHGIYPENQPDWSPDGAKLAYTGGYCDNSYYYYCYTDIYVMNADGSGVTQLTGTSSASQPAWSPDGNLIAFSSYYGSAVYVIRTDGSGITQVVGGPSSDPVWRP